MLTLKSAVAVNVDDRMVVSLIRQCWLCRRNLFRKTVCGRTAVGLVSMADLKRKKRTCRGDTGINVKYVGPSKASQGGSLSKHRCPGISG